MRLHDDAAADVVDRFLIERFLLAADVTAKKLELYGQFVTDETVRSHFTEMNAGLERAKKQLQDLANQLDR